MLLFSWVGVRVPMIVEVVMRVGKVDTGVLCLMEGDDNGAACVDLLFTLVNSLAQRISQPI